MLDRLRYKISREDEGAEHQEECLAIVGRMQEAKLKKVRKGKNVGGPPMPLGGNTGGNQPGRLT